LLIYMGLQYIIMQPGHGVSLSARSFSLVRPGVVLPLGGPRWTGIKRAASSDKPLLVSKRSVNAKWLIISKAATTVTDGTTVVGDRQCRYVQIPLVRFVVDLLCNKPNQWSLSISVFCGEPAGSFVKLQRPAWRGRRG